MTGKKRKGGRKRDRDRTVLHMTAEKKVLAVSFLPSQKACCYLARMAYVGNRFLIVLLFPVFLDRKVPVNPPLGRLDSLELSALASI